jgi:hypothetical protein
VHCIPLLQAHARYFFPRHSILACLVGEDRSKVALRARKNETKVTHVTATSGANLSETSARWHCWVVCFARLLCLILCQILLQLHDGG